MAKSRARQRASGRERRKMAEAEARKRRMYLIVGSVVAAILIVLLGVFVVTQGDDGSSMPPVVAIPAGISAEMDGRVAGNPEATVHVVEWGDYQCPACARFKQEAVPVLIDEYINTGLITFEFRDFAFLGPESYQAAEAAACALDQGRFWDYHSTIFANHNGENRGAYSDSRLREMAEDLELDMEEFNACFDDGVHEETVINMYEEGSALGVNSTPTLVINGELVGYAGMDDLRSRLDALLQG